MRQLSTVRADCPAVTCEGPCPRTGCICPRCDCADCRRRARISTRGVTPLRRPVDVPVRERLFEPEPDPIGVLRR